MSGPFTDSREVRETLGSSVAFKGGAGGGEGGTGISEPFTDSREVRETLGSPGDSSLSAARRASSALAFANASIASVLSFPTFGGSFFLPPPKSPATLSKRPSVTLILPGSFFTGASSRCTMGLDSSNGSSAQASSRSNSVLGFSRTGGI